VLETGFAPPRLGDRWALEAFDKSLGGRTSRLVDWSARAPEVIADSVRHVLGRADSPTTPRSPRRSIRRSTATGSRT
jgi:hypothetical protein